MEDGGVTGRNLALAKSWVSPFILRILGHFKASDVSQAVEEDMSLVRWLAEDRDTLNRLRVLLDLVPFGKSSVKRILPHIGDQEWIGWFVGNELQHRRPDLFAVFAYNPRARGWLDRNLKELSGYLEQAL